MSDDRLDAELKAFFLELAEASARVIRPHFGDPALAVESKADLSPVTVADRGAEEIMRDLIRRRYPDHGVIGEEFGTERADAEFVWVLDPIDGTLSFTHGVPLFGTLVGLLQEGRPRLGMIHQPILERLCLGDGHETLLNGRPVRIRPAPSLDQAEMLYTDTTHIEKHQNYHGWETLRRSVRLTRSWGDCFGYLLLSTGSADIMLDPIMNPWDLLPLIPVVRGAGGHMTAWDGSDVEKAASCVAAHPDLHPRVLEALHRKTG